MPDTTNLQDFNTEILEVKQAIGNQEREEKVLKACDSVLAVELIEVLDISKFGRQLL